MRGEFSGDPRALFADLVDAQRGRHCAFIRIGDWAICSASPELFFELDGPYIRARPMKGTLRRGLTTSDDERQREELRGSAKQRAENVMIVDMVRNDLGRIADVGSVEVPELFSVERYPNVWQMTSLVSARSIASLEDIVAAMHPSASVTGAPKVRTMAILSELEAEPRGVYTGAIGHVPPDGNAHFNVAIRTAVVDVSRAQVEFGIGSGIVWDSDASAEYDECLLKGSVITDMPVRFELLETLRWDPERGFFLLQRHLDRLRDSAGYFDFPFDEEAVRKALDGGISEGAGSRRVRLLLDRTGAITTEQHAHIQQRAPVKVALAAHAVARDAVWLYHKTTHRAIYENARARSRDCDEVILWNAAGQVTEATTANVVIEIDGAKVTPPVECGLLAGVFRAELLARGEIQERVVMLDDLRSATRIWLVNSVQEWREAIL
jgi:para-aminobenzoate synthetase/4-amino-4-deoxychorismate lyase